MVEHQARLLGSQVQFPAGAFTIFPFLPKLHSQFPSPILFSLSPFPSSSFPFPSPSDPFVVHVIISFNYCKVTNLRPVPIFVLLT